MISWNSVPFQLLSSGENEGQCLANNTCICSDKDKPTSEAIEVDRDNSAFRAEFGERINKVLFTKERGDDKDDHTNITETEIINTSVSNPNKQSTNKSLSELEKYYKQFKQAKVKLQNASVTGDIFNFTVIGLQYFQDYEFHVCLVSFAVLFSNLIDYDEETFHNEYMRSPPRNTLSYLTSDVEILFRHVIIGWLRRFPDKLACFLSALA